MSNITEEQIRQMMADSFKDVKPNVEKMTHILMDVYQLGYNAGFNIGLKLNQG